MAWGQPPQFEKNVEEKERNERNWSSKMRDIGVLSMIQLYWQKPWKASSACVCVSVFMFVCVCLSVSLFVHEHACLSPIPALKRCVFQ